MRAWVCALMLALSLSAWAADWQSLDGSDFSVSFPGEAKRSEREDETQIGKVKSQVWSVELEHEAFTLSVTDYPAELVKRSLPQKMLEGARDGAVANVGGTLDKDLALFLDGGEPKTKWPGREFSLHTDKGYQMNSRVFLVSNRLFTVLVVRDETVKEPTDFVRFADSLKLKKKAPKKK